MSNRIVDEEQLTVLLKDREQIDVFIMLNGGLRSSKTLIYHEGGGVFRYIATLMTASTTTTP